jgi:hypothetical protein
MEEPTGLQLNLQSRLANRMLRPIVQNTVIKHQQHILHKVIMILIGIILQLRLYYAEVHRPLYYGRVVGDAQLDWVDWLDEQVPEFGFP